jgi:hypothetical protein
VDLSGGGAYGLELTIEPDLAALAAPHFCVVVVCGARGVYLREIGDQHISAWGHGVAMDRRSIIPLARGTAESIVSPHLIIWYYLVAQSPN